ncbi:MAG: peptide ABC transporter [Actinobacteria bacterium RBG_16_64_13]|nr:MAG: peptide ABC transporter [Actinobacteria bacterium RBG_16_64_13]
MVTYVIRRFVIGILVLVLVSLIVFFSLRLLPGDPALIYVASQVGGTGVTQEKLDEIRVEFGLDKPVPVQYLNWVKGVISGDLGKSVKNNKPVTALLGERFQPTLVIGLVSLVLSTVLGIFFGLVAAIRRGSWIDTLVTLLSYVGIVVPAFMLAFVLLYLFGLKLNWLPMVGWTPPWEDFGMSVKQSIMPVIVLATVPLAITARQMRSSVLEVNNMDFIRTAWSKGLRERVIVFRHISKNSLIPVITLMGIGVGLIFGGAVIEETIFSIPGMGRLMVSSIFDRDYVVIQSMTMIIAAIIVFANIVVDISYGWLDPRIRYG